MASTIEQRTNALKRANVVRLARAKHKRDPKAIESLSGTRRAAAALIERPPEELLKMTVMELLCGAWRHGETLSKRYLRQAGIVEGKTIGTLTDRQRWALVTNLRGLGG